MTEIELHPEQAAALELAAKWFNEVYPRRTEALWAKSCIQAEWGWAITAHKSQGSQWDKVLVFDESWAFREDKAKWLYTAITRAAKELTIVRL